jgi:hypothetical protein
MPTRVLPRDANLAHLKHQAVDLARAREARALDACQRIREFHPRFRGASDAAIADATFLLSDAQLAIAREYGFPSWPKLKAHVEQPDRSDLSLPHHERIVDAPFRKAIDLLDAGEADGLRTYLSEHPQLARRRVTFEGGNYFTHPALLEFVAENPTRRGSLPPNIVEIARIILDAGGEQDRSSVDEALALVSSSNIARECGVQQPLIELLCDRGADPNAGMLPSLLYGEFAAVEALIRRGAIVDLTTAAATGRVENARGLVAAASDEERQRALALAAQFGHVDIVRLLLDAGADPNRFSPAGGHSHATPLHQAALAGHTDIARLLVERGARLDIADVLYHATPLGWAEHAGRHEVAEYLRARSNL